MNESMSQVNEDTFLITSQKREEEILENAMKKLSTDRSLHSTYFNESSSSIDFKINDIDKLAFNAQSNLNNILKINNIVRYFVNKNDILGKVYEAIETNVNSDWTLQHYSFNEEEKEIFEKVDKLIRTFNEKIKIGRLVTEAIPMAYLEGNYIVYLRKDIEKSNYQVDYYPLGVSEIADYDVNGEPYILINIRELESRLRKVYKKTKKNTPLFYKDIEEEIRNTYPPEVIKAFLEKEPYAVLSIKNSGLIRINNFKRKYGLTPIFKSLKAVIRLENIELSDDKNTLVRGKKIIFQKISSDLITKHNDLPNITWSAAQAKAHVDLMTSLQSKGISVYTGLPWTEDIKYIEPKLEQTNVQIKNQYRNEIMTSVGISYLNSDKTGYGVSQISITELMKMINKISEQLEYILFKWYKELLIDNGIDEKYCPKIKVIDSEKLSMEISISLAKLLNSELNASLETVYSTLGLDVKTEAKRRKEEEELGYTEIFKPRLTAFTNSGKSDEVGRPSDSKDLDKKSYDQDYNKENGR